jgi:hypothetical protein
VTYTSADIDVDRLSRTYQVPPTVKDLADAPGHEAVTGVTYDHDWRLTPVGWRAAWRTERPLNATGDNGLRTDGTSMLYDDITAQGTVVHRGQVAVVGQGWPLDDYNVNWIGSSSGSGTATSTIDCTPNGWTVNQWAGYVLHNLTAGWNADITANDSNTLTLSGTYTYGSGDYLEIWAGITRGIVYGSGNPYFTSPRHSRRYALQENQTTLGNTDVGFTGQLVAPGGSDLIAAEREVESWDGVKVLSQLTEFRNNCDSVAVQYKIPTVSDSPHIPGEVELLGCDQALSIYDQRADLVAEDAISPNYNNSALFHVLPVLAEHYNLLAWYVNGWKRCFPLCTVCDVLFLADGQTFRMSDEFGYYTNGSVQIGSNSVGMQVSVPWTIRTYTAGDPMIGAFEELGFTVRTNADLPGQDDVDAIDGTAAITRYLDINYTKDDSGEFVYQTGTYTYTFKDSYTVSLGSMSSSAPPADYSGGTWNYYSFPSWLTEPGNIVLNTAEEAVIDDILTFFATTIKWLDARDVKAFAESIGMVFVFERCGVPGKFVTATGEAPAILVDEDVIGVQGPIEWPEYLSDGTIRRQRNLYLNYLGADGGQLTPPAPGDALPGTAPNYYITDGTYTWRWTNIYTTRTNDYQHYNFKHYITITTAGAYARMANVHTANECDYFYTENPYDGPYQSLLLEYDVTSGIGGDVLQPRDAIGGQFVWTLPLDQPDGVLLFELPNPPPTPSGDGGGQFLISDGRPDSIRLLDHYTRQSFALAISVSNPSGKLSRQSILTGSPDYYLTFDDTWLTDNGTNLALGPLAIPRTLAVSSGTLVAVPSVEEITVLTPGPTTYGSWQVLAHNRAFMDLT